MLIYIKRKNGNRSAFGIPALLGKPVAYRHQPHVKGEEHGFRAYVEEAEGYAASYAPRDHAGDENY